MPLVSAGRERMSDVWLVLLVLPAVGCLAPCRFRVVVVIGGS